MFRGVYLAVPRQPRTPLPPPAPPPRPPAAAFDPTADLKPARFWNDHRVVLATNAKGEDVLATVPRTEGDDRSVIDGDARAQLEDLFARAPHLQAADVVIAATNAARLNDRAGPSVRHLRVDVGEAMRALDGAMQGVAVALHATLRACALSRSHAVANARSDTGAEGDVRAWCASVKERVARERPALDDATRITQQLLDDVERQMRVLPFLDEAFPPEGRAALRSALASLVEHAGRERATLAERLEALQPLTAGLGRFEAARSAMRAHAGASPSEAHDVVVTVPGPDGAARRLRMRPQVASSLAVDARDAAISASFDREDKKVRVPFREQPLVVTHKQRAAFLDAAALLVNAVELAHESARRHEGRARDLSLWLETGVVPPRIAMTPPPPRSGAAAARATRSATRPSVVDGSV
jgi:hypothetical protein